MDNLGDLLRQRGMDEPLEIRAIKDYVRRYYDAEVSVSLTQRGIVVAAPSAALIGTLRMNLPKLQEAAATDRRIMFRIGS